MAATVIFWGVLHKIQSEIICFRKSSGFIAWGIWWETDGPI